MGQGDIGLLISVGTFGRIGIEAIRDGKRVSPFSGDLPSTIRQLTKKAFSYESSEEALVQHVSLYPDQLPPLFLSMDKQQILLDWDDTLTGQAKTAFEILDEEVKLTRIVEIGEKPVSNLVKIGKGLLLNLADKKIGQIQDLEGWQAWRDLCFSDDEPSTGKGRKKTVAMPAFDDLNVPIFVSLDAFNEYQAAHKGLQDYLVLQSQTDTVITDEVDASELSYQIQLSVDDWESQVNMAVTAMVKDQPVGMDKALFTGFNALRKNIPNGKRKPFKELAAPTFINALFDKALVAELNTPILEEAFPEMPSLLEQGQALVTPLQGVVEKKLLVEGANCIQYNLDMTGEAQLYDLLFSFFAELNWTYKKSIEISLSKKQFDERVDALYKACKQAGITLTWDGVKIEVRDLDFHLSVTQNKDWFSLHPDIKANGESLSPELLEKLYQSSRIYKEDGSWVLLSQNSQDILERIKGAVIDEKKKKKDIIKLNRLQILDALFLKAKGVQVTLPKAYDYLFSLIEQESSLENCPLPKGFTGELRQYQQEGYNWIGNLYRYGFGGCLADDMGLGKTVQTLVFLQAVKEGAISSEIIKRGNNPFLIVVPPSLKFVWAAEVEKFCPNMSLEDYSELEDKESYKSLDVLLATYDIVRRDIEWFKSKKFDVVIFDEAQLIKNIYTGRTAAVRQLNTGFKLCLTGTPIENHLGEYYSIIDLAIPGLLESYENFQRYLKDQAESRDYQRLIRRTQPFVLRRVKEKILSELPEKMEQSVVLDMSDTQKTMYENVITELRKHVSDTFAKESSQKAMMTALTALLRLRQICVSPRLLDPTMDERSPKVSYLIENLKELQEGGHSALIFSQFRQFLDVLEDEVRAEGLPYLRMDGKTPVKQRQGLVEKFQNSDKPTFFLISLKTGGIGLNLTKASYVFHLDPWWNPSVEEQASDRVYRIGQTQKVFISRLIMHHSIEEKIMTLKEEKKALFTSVLDKGIATNVSGKLTQKDLRFLLGD